MATSAPDSAPVYYPPAPTGLRRPAIIAAVLTVIVAIIAVFLGSWLFPLFFAIGVVAVFINTKMVIMSVERVAAEENPRKKLLAVNSAARLGAITVLALAAAFLTAATFETVSGLPRAGALAGHAATAARRAFQVLTAEEPHRVSRVSPISSSATSASRRAISASL